MPVDSSQTKIIFIVSSEQLIDASRVVVSVDEEATTLSREDIKDLWMSELSIMPEGFEKLPPEDLFSLLDFLKEKLIKILEDAPEKIAILRLDTDWYESTKHELRHLFPRISPRGVIIIDDYGEK